MVTKILPKIIRTARTNKASKITNPVSKRASKTVTKEAKNQSIFAEIFGITVKKTTPEGFIKTKYVDGIKVSETVKKTGNPLFEKNFFDEDGQIKKTRTYTNTLIPKLREETTFNNGVKLKTIEIMPNRTITTRFYSDGKPRTIKEEGKDKYKYSNSRYFLQNGTLQRELIEREAYGKHIIDSYMRQDGTLLTKIDSYGDKYFYQVFYSKDGKKIVNSKTWEVKNPNLTDGL